MEVGERGSRAGSPGEAPGQGASLAPSAGRRPFDAQRVWEILGEWQKVELRIARGFAECRGLNEAQLEDIYQNTALALYRRPYVGEEHLRNALRDGIKRRALRAHRDERRHSEILARNAPSFHRVAEAQEGQSAPEPSVLAHEDRLIAGEFLTELTEPERRVFGGLVEGLAYRAIATALDIPVNEARNTARVCERKRERFQLLYDTGRLCGYRAQTILALQAGESTSEELAERAFAHLESCVHCRLQHKTNAKRLRRSFRDQAAALLPPVALGHLGWLSRLGVRARLLAHRLGVDTAPLGQGGVRERAVAVLAGGAGAKVAVGVVTLGVLAGGAVATHVLEQSPRAPHRHVVRSTAVAPVPTSAAARSLSSSPFVSTQRASAHRGVKTSKRSDRRRGSARRSSGTARSSAAGQREPGGFAYLGVPTTPSSVAAPAQAASSSEDQHGGGQFSP